MELKMERKSIVPENGSFLDLLGSAIDTTICQVNHLSELSRNTELLKRQTPFIDEELNFLAKTDDIYSETKAFYDEVKDHPINLDSIENRLLSLRAQLIEINDHPALIKKGLEPFIPVRSVPVTESSYLSPVPTNRSRQSQQNSFASSGPKSVAKSLVKCHTPIVDNVDSAMKTPRQQVMKYNFPEQESNPEIVNKEPEEPAIKYNISDPELNSVMARLAKWKTNY